MEPCLRRRRRSHPDLFPQSNTNHALTLSAKKCWPLIVVSISPLATVVRGKPELASCRACKRNSSRIRRPHSRANGLSKACPERSALHVDVKAERESQMEVAVAFAVQARVGTGGITVS